MPFWPGELPKHLASVSNVLKKLETFGNIFGKMSQNTEQETFLNIYANSYFVIAVAILVCKKIAGNSVPFL